MKTLTASVREPRELDTAVGKKWLGPLTAILREALVLAVAITVAAAMITLSVWLAGKSAGPVLAVCIWGLGFVFLGLAVDSRGLRAVFLGMTGLALPLLALLQDRVSPDFMIVSGVLLAAWAGHGILSHKAPQVT